MAKHDRNELKAGLFIVISVILMGVIIVAIKGVRTVFQPTVFCRARFALVDDVGGLRVGDDVRLGGFKVGVIKSIEVTNLQNTEEPSIVIGFTVPATYSLHESAHIAVQGTLTGSSWLNIDSLGSGSMLAESGELTGHSSALTQLSASLSGSGPELRSILHDVHDVTLPKVNQVTDRASNALGALKELAVSIGSLFGDTKTDIRGTLANLNSITGTAKDKIPGLLDHLDQATVKITAAVDSATGALEDVKVTAANTRALTGTARAVIVGNRGKLEGIIASLKATSDNLKGATAEIRRSPWRVLYKPAPGEMDNLTLFDAARQFSDGATNLNDAAQALRDSMQDPNADHAQVQKLVQKLADSFANFNDVEQKLWQAVKK